VDGNSVVGTRTDTNRESLYAKEPNVCQLNGICYTTAGLRTGTILRGPVFSGIVPRERLRSKALSTRRHVWIRRVRRRRRCYGFLGDERVNRAALFAGERRRFYDRAPGERAGATADGIDGTYSKSRTGDGTRPGASGARASSPGRHQ